MQCLQSIKFADNLRCLVSSDKVLGRIECLSFIKNNKHLQTRMEITIAILSLLLYSLPGSSSSSSLSLGCIDDSDCVPLGHQYACYFYRCLNWLSADTGLQHCTRDWQCGAGHRCYRHHNLREVSAGICFPASQLETCRHHEDCEEDTPHCCGMWCCPPEYFRSVG